MLGASACVVFINLLVVQPRFQIALVAILAALSSGLHYQNAQTYRVENERLNNYFWQMAWRVPGLEPGTTIVSDDIPLYRYSDNDITPIVNWTYAPDLKGNRLLYKYFDLSTRESSPLPGFSDGLRFGHSYRNHQFQGSTSQVLAIYYDLSHCLWLLSPEDQVVPDLPPSLYDVLPISRPDLVLVDVQPTANPPKQLGKEPEHGWCYAYEKAELSRQAGDWETIATLGDQAWESGLEPGHPIEYLPFIQGYANIGNMEQVHRLMEIVLQDAELKPSLCSRLQIDSVQKSKNINQEIERMRKEIGCKL
jgi:hypothetical protein